MKEYKVASYKLSLSGNNEKLELFLNTHAREGWVFRHMMDSYMIIFERNKKQIR